MNLIQLILKYPENLLNRDFIIDLFSVSQIMTIEEATSAGMLYPGKLINLGKEVKYISELSDGKVHVMGDTDVSLKRTEPLLTFADKITLTPGVIANHTQGSLTTTIGRLVLNYALLAKPFGDVIPFINGPWKLSSVEGDIAKEVVAKTIKVKSVYEYVDNAYFLTSYTDFCVPAMSEKAITIDPSVLKRRDELLAKYSDEELKDPKLMMAIEDELIALDKASLAGDPSNDWMISGKNYDVHRKRMFLSVGMVQSFGDETPGYTFSKTNLDDGWKQEDFDTLSNDIRRGSYDRAKNTAKGGAESKYLGRSFQESAIVEDNCKTKRGLLVRLTTTNAKSFEHRTIIDKGKLVVITPENTSKYVNKEVLLRSPMYCASKGGYCYTCMDSRFKDLGIKLLNTLPINIGSSFLLESMKKMHGTKVTTFELSSLDEFTI